MVKHESEEIGKQEPIIVLREVFESPMERYSEVEAQDIQLVTHTSEDERQRR